MFTLKIENRKGQSITLSQNEKDYQIVSIDGLSQPPANINRASTVGMDGSRYNSAKLQERNIVLNIRINGDVEANRLNLYKYFKTKEMCRIFYKNGARDVFIDGYVETIECGLFTRDERMQISIICLDPFFKGLEEISEDISKTLSLFTFPFAINTDDPVAFSSIEVERTINISNASEAETGVIIDINVIDAFNTIKIQNISTGDFISLTYEFEDDDHIVINTNKGEKSIKLIRNGIEYNIFSSIDRGSKFLQLDIGDNYFSYLVNDEQDTRSVQLKFSHHILYRGV